MGEGRELPYPDMDIRVVRRHANARAISTSVRSIAAQIGVGHTRLDKFLAGSEPFAKTANCCANGTCATTACTRSRRNQRRC